MNNYTEIECIPDPSCKCCVCLGWFCHYDHPTHWHQNPDYPDKTLVSKTHPTAGPEKGAGC